MNFSQFLKVEGQTLIKNKGEHIFMQGDIDRSLYIVQQGLIKAYYVSEDGKESVKSFLMPENIIGSLASAFSKEMCTFSLICLEPSTLVKVPFDVLQEHSTRNHEFALQLNDTLLHFAMKKEKREFELLCLSAEARFAALVEKSPSLLKRVTQNDIARYLGVTPVGLSRIKKRVLENSENHKV